VNTSNPTLYTLTSVNRAFQDHEVVVNALSDATLRIQAGDVVAVVGPSGSGKSTLLLLLGALEKPTSGTILFDGQDIAAASEAELTALRRATIGFVFQQFNLIPTLNARENVALAMQGLGLDRVARRARAEALLEQVGLADRADHLPSRLSGGEQQRVAIARALANSPRVIIADEPTGNLDATTAQEVMTTLLALQRESGVTLIIATHDAKVGGYAKQHLAMEDGRIVADGQPRAHKVATRLAASTSAATWTSDEQPLYHLGEVSRTFDVGSRRVEALSDITFDIAPGDAVSLEGPSGSGKSTLLLLLGALETPSTGELRFEDRELTRASDRDLTTLRRTTLGYVFQQFNLIPTMTAVQNVELAMRPNGVPRQDRERKALELLEQVGLAHRAHHLPSRLSGGEQQRVAIARALSNQPRVLIADEPTGNLDSANTQEIMRLLVDLQKTKGVTLILATHDEAVSSHARRRIQLRSGRIVGDSAA